MHDKHRQPKPFHPVYGFCGKGGEPCCRRNEKGEHLRSCLFTYFKIRPDLLKFISSLQPLPGSELMLTAPLYSSALLIMFEMPIPFLGVLVSNPTPSSAIQIKRW